MAVLALGFAGQALGGAIGGSILGVSSAAIGGFIGSTIGGMVDNLLFPQKQTGPRLDDLTVTASTYGKPLPLLFGPENRIAGNVIWSTGLIETKKKSKQGGKGAPSVSVTEYTYRASFAVAVAEGVLSRLRKVWANNALIYDVDNPSAVETALYSAIRFYPGTFTQTPDPTIEGYVGVGQTPAYRGTSYVVFEDLQLADYGNRLPNIEFLVEAQAEITVAAVVSDLIVRCGLSDNQASTIALTEQLRGYAIGTASSGVGALQPLALAYDFDVAEVAGALRCTRRSAAVLGVVMTDDLAGHEGGSERPADAIRWSRGQVTNLPREATITFPDPERDWQKNSQRARRSQGSADSALGTEIAVVLTADEGRRLADRMLWEAWTGMQTANAQTDDRWISLEPGRKYLFQTPAGLEPLRVTRKTRGWNGVIDLDLRRDSDEVYMGSTNGVPAPAPPNPVSLPGLSQIILLDIPLLLDADEPSETGFYYGVVGSGPGWRGADVLRSIGSTGPYENVSPQGRELTLGVIEELDAPTGGFDSATSWDMANVVTVILDRADMELESLSDEEVLAGGNAMFIGDLGDTPSGEIIQFAEADMVAPGVYELSRLRRGQRGTEAFWSGHSSGDVAVLLEPGSLLRADFGAADLNQERFYKAVSLLTFEVDADAVAFTNTGVGLRPYAPIQLVADAVSSGGDVELTWVRRSRIGWPEIDPPPLAEDEESYRLEILTAGGVVKRSVTLSEPSFDYTAAMQTADFGAPVSTLRWRVAQIGTVFGVGIFAESSGPV